MRPVCSVQITRHNASTEFRLNVRTRENDFLTIPILLEKQFFFVTWRLIRVIADTDTRIAITISIIQNIIVNLVRIKSTCSLCFFFFQIIHNLFVENLKAETFLNHADMKRIKTTRFFLFLWK